MMKKSGQGVEMIAVSGDLDEVDARRAGQVAQSFHAGMAFLIHGRLKFRAGRVDE